MAAMFLNITLNFKKLKKKNSNKSLWAFLVSVFIYISAFYVFNLSLSTLLCTTKFWFVISNTLIIILAADFSSSKENDRDSHEELEYLKSSVNSVTPKCDVHVPSLVKSTVVEEIVSNDHHVEDPEVDDTPEEKTIDVIYSSLTKYDHRCGDHESDDENKSGIIIISLNEENNDRSQQNPNEKIMFPEVKNGGREVRKNRKGTCIRSYSDKGILTAVAAENEEKFVLQRTLSEKRQEPAIIDEENDEYSNMSNEELNRRVEEFIRRFNNQIRLQAAKNRQNLHEQPHQIS